MLTIPQGAGVCLCVRIVASVVRHSPAANNDMKNLELVATEVPDIRCDKREA